MIFKKTIRPILFSQDPEKAHDAMLYHLESISKGTIIKKTLEHMFSFEDKRLRVTLDDLRFSNPVGLAAGFDKNAKVFSLMQAFGFGHVEVGTVTGKGQEGNPKPRMFRLAKDRALINRMGFNGLGAKKISEILQKTTQRTPSKIPLGINIGKTKVVALENATDDYLYSFELLYPFGDYFVINVSSPNTPNLRELQDKDKLLDLLLAIQKKNKNLAELTKTIPKKIFVKIAPDLNFSQIDDVLDVLKKTHCSGIIGTNTTIARPNLRTAIDEQGGLSGRPITKKSRDVVHYIYEKTNGKLPIIGVGGVFNARDACRMIQSGASLVQIYTGFVYEGPSCVKNINQGLVRYMKKHKIRNVSELVGRAHI